jgi:hypothetical protein
MTNRTFSVTLLLPAEPGDTHEEAARSFVKDLRAWLDGGIDTLALSVTDEDLSVFEEGTTKVVYLRAKED